MHAKLIRRWRKNENDGPRSRAVAVLRHSTTSVQPNGIWRWCGENHASVVAWIDEDEPWISPADRPKLGPYLSRDPPVEWDVLIAHSMDRMTEDVDDALGLIAWCREHGRRFVLADQPVDSAEPIQPSVLAALFPDDPVAHLRLAGGDRDG